MTKAAGINVGKANLHVSASGGPVVRFNNAATGITKLLKHRQNPDTVPAVCGPTDGYERRLPSRPRPSETAVRVDHPGRTRTFAETCGYEAKTDPLDAQMLARHSEAFPEAYTWEPVTDLHRQEMKGPLRRWRQFIDQRVQEKGRLDRGVSATIARSTQPHIAWLEKEIAQLDQEYQAVLKDNPILAEPVDLYPTVPRVGPLTTATLVAHLAELGLTHSKALTSLVELAPWLRDSGKRRDIGPSGAVVDWCVAPSTRGLGRSSAMMGSCGASMTACGSGGSRAMFGGPDGAAEPAAAQHRGSKGAPRSLRNSGRSPHLTLRWLDIQHECSADRHVACRSESPGCAGQCIGQGDNP